MQKFQQVARTLSELPKRAVLWACRRYRKTRFFLERHVNAVSRRIGAKTGGPLLLMCDQGVPSPTRHAGDLAVIMYLSLFRGMGWRTLFCPLYPSDCAADVAGLEENGTIVLDSPAALQVWLRSYGHLITASWVARPTVAETLLPEVRRASSAPVVYFTHDLHYVRLEREAQITHDPEAAALAMSFKQAETRIFKAVDGIFAPGKAEVAAIQESVTDKPVGSIPLHFYDAEDIRVRSREHFATRSDIIFVGGFPHSPNVDAALFVAQKVMPIVWRHCPDATLFLVGHSPPPIVLSLAGERVIVTGYVPDIEPYYDRARVALLGLRFGAGVKGKTLEAFRYGVPVCGTSVAIEGIDALPGVDAMVSDTAEGLAANTVKLLNDPFLCESLASAGNNIIRRDYTRMAAENAIRKIVDRCSLVNGRPLDLSHG